MIKDFRETSQCLATKFKVRVLNEDVMPKEDLIALDYLRAGEKAYMQEEYNSLHASFLHWAKCMPVMLLCGVLLGAAGIWLMLLACSNGLSSTLYCIMFILAGLIIAVGIMICFFAADKFYHRGSAVRSQEKLLNAKTRVYELMDLDLETPDLMSEVGSFRVLFKTLLVDKKLLEGEHSYVVIVRDGASPFIMERDLALSMNTGNSLVGIYMIASHDLLSDAILKEGCVSDEKK